MKKFLFAVGLLLMVGLQSGYAQKSLASDYNFHKALELAEEENASEALKYVNLYIDEHPDACRGYLLRARLYRSQSMFGQALTDANNALRYWSKGDEVPRYSPYLWRAEIYFNMEMYDKALVDYSTVYKLIAKSDDLELIHSILSQRADLYYHLGDYAKAEADYRLMLKHNEADQLAMIGLARNMIQHGDYQAAVDMTTQCAKFDASYEEVYRFRMQAYDKLGQTDLAIDDAIRYFETSGEPDPSIFEDVLKKHYVYSLAKVNEKCNEHDNDYSWRMLRLTLYEWNQDYVGAIEEYNKIEREYGASRSIYFYRSKCYLQIGDAERAIADITKCMELSGKDDIYSLESRADLYRKLGRYDEAIADFSKMIELLPTDAYAYYKRGWCYELKGDDERAMENYNAGIDIDKDYPYIFLMRGSQYLKQGNVELANADFEEVLRQDSVVADGSCRQYALHFLGRDEEALEWMDRLVALDDTDGGTYYDKACLLARMGHLDEAVDALRGAFERGYRTFAHIEHDDDLDSLRNHSGFIALIDEYKGKTSAEVAAQQGLQDRMAVLSEVAMKKCYGGTYEVACTVNGLPLKFILDTGAATVSISSVEASFMLKNGYLASNDIKGKEYFSTATGEIHEGTTIRLKEIKIGDAVLCNVDASVVHNQQAPLLLGQSVLERFGTITIDNINSKLIIKQ